jgi:hypothetical protein
VTDLEQGAENYHGCKKSENEVEDYLASLGFKEQHNGFVFLDY